jgi:hypothetical protein
MLLRKFSFTLCAAAFIGAYSLTHAVIKRFRPKFEAKLQSASDVGWPTLPSEIQKLILEEAVSILDDTGLLNLSLTCKQYDQLVSTSNIWSNRQTSLFRLSTAFIDEACHNIGFSRKIEYFFKHKKLIYIGGSVVRPRTADISVIGYHNSDLYVPWLVNDFLKRPATFWKFLRTIIVHPESFYKFLVQEDMFSSKVAIHAPTVGRIGKHVKILGIVLSILPWLDIFIAKSPIVAAIGSADSLKDFFELIWNFDMPIWNIMHLSLPLLFGALIDNVFYYSDLVPYHAIMSIIMLLFNKGLKTALILSSTTVLPAILYQRFAGKYLWYAPPWILMVLPLLYFNPIVSIYMFLVVVAIVWDMAQRALRPRQEKMKFAQMFLLMGTMSAISAVVVALLK